MNAQPRTQAAIRNINTSPAYVLSLLIAVLAAVASGGGLLLSSLYRDNLLVTAAWKGNDLVTLCVAVPLLVAALVYARRGSRREP